MSEDIQKGATPPRRRPPDDDDYGPDAEQALAPPYAQSVVAAGVIWIVFGCLVLLNLLIVLIGTFVLAANVRGAGAGAVFSGTVCYAVFVAFVGAVFIHVGRQSIRGTARDTLGNGVGSIIFAVLIGAVAAVMFVGLNFLDAGIGVLESAALLAAGVLALVGRSPYRLWRKTQKDRRARNAAQWKSDRRGEGGPWASLSE